MSAGLPADSLGRGNREIAPKLEVATGWDDKLTLDQPIGGSNPPSPAVRVDALLGVGVVLDSIERIRIDHLGRDGSLSANSVVAHGRDVMRHAHMLIPCANGLDEF